MTPPRARNERPRATVEGHRCLSDRRRARRDRPARTFLVSQPPAPQIRVLSGIPGR